jgi:hypothetical protein
MAAKAKAAFDGAFEDALDGDFDAAFDDANFMTVLRCRVC